MGKNLLVINVDIRETRVALIENGIIAELHIERDAQKGTLGNIYLGRVSRVLPGMQAAFIDIGLERAAFLHVEDLIRPDDFDAYLAGRHTHGTAHEEEERPAHVAPEITAHVVPEEPARSERDVSISLPTALDVMAEPSGEEVYEEAEEEQAAEAQSVEGPTSDEPTSEESATEETAAAEAAPEGEEAAASEEARAEEEADSSAEADDEAEVAEASADEGEQEEAAPAEEGAEAAAAEGKVEGAVEAAETSPTAPRGGRSRRGRGQRGRVRRSGRTRDRRPEAAAAAAVVTKEAPREAAREAPRAPREGRDRDRGGDKGDKGRGRDGGRGGRDRGGDRGGDRTATKRAHGGHHDPMRVSKTTPIREVIREGQEVLVQVSKEPIGTKGARVTSHVSLPGRYVVYLPTVDHVGISKRIGSEKERSRLREAIESMKPPQGGLIVRTVAEGLTKKQLKSDVGYLVRLWGEVVKKRESVVRGPACLYTELDLVLKTARDLFTDDIEKIVIDSREEYVRLKRFMEMFMPERVDAVELYEGEEPIFDAYGIEDEIQRALSRKVPLPSGGHLIIDQAEALTAIDVNTGKFVGKGSRDLEETILTTNLEAVEEIAYQLRFRNIGGLIILDLIDMERAGNREKVRKRLEELLSKDKAKTTFNRISELGLIEMTRKRTRESLGRIMLEPCFYCDGTGQLQSKQSIAYEILRQIRRERLNLPGYVVIVNAHPAIVDLLKNDERVAVQEAERLFTRRIELVPRKEYHLEQFDLLGR
ncbi:Rne/Rng family ribonuclease [Polyangium sp. y55x31]|uniref:Rne/Rng family ribonuclease n=1 Tax=Polyangium sp. y55x31 TaxID=3042688 RepID=UPI0024823C3D|nr:Rne/Rng family ribonuclease [Polyangium sp. y55x31]MDI1481888.1 Rne/Rng family ribonuclease [Polyangium sp. y55x31]